jgi:hypothetical protein
VLAWPVTVPLCLLAPEHTVGFLFGVRCRPSADRKKSFNFRKVIMRNIVQIVFTFVAIAVIFSFLVISQQMDLAHFSSSYFHDMVNREFAGTNGSKVPTITTLVSKRESIAESLSSLFGFNNKSQYHDDSNKLGDFSVIGNSFLAHEGNNSVNTAASIFSDTTDQAINTGEATSTNNNVAGVKVSLVCSCLIGLAISGPRH